MSTYSLYLLECADGSFYAGIARDLERRLKVHNSGKGAKYTRARLPVRLLWSMDSLTHSEALKCEHQIKKLTREEKLLLIGLQ